MIGALATVLTGVLNEQEALSSIRWQVLSLVNIKRVVTVFCEPPSTGAHDWQLI